jgi:hypothetical protein
VVAAVAAGAGVRGAARAQPSPAAAPAVPAATRATLYPAPPGVPRAADFRVWVDGRELFLYDSEVAAYGIFSMGGPVDVVVRPAHDVRRVDVRPLSAGIRPAVRPDEIRFRLDRPRSLSVELNGESRRVLHLFAAPPERDAPAPGAPGVRYFAAGRVHDVGLVTLDSGQTAYVAGGAVVRGGFRARGGGGVRIVGRGVVDASGLERGARMIELVGVRDARVEGVTLVNSGGWTVVPVRADGFVARDLKILNWRTGSDGIDLVATSHAVVEDSFVRANDDCVAVKTWGGDPGYPGSRPSAAPTSRTSPCATRRSGTCRGGTRSRSGSSCGRRRCATCAS